MNDDYQDDQYLDDDDPIPYVTFELQNQLYGISASQVKTMLETPEITPVPHTPHYVRGLIKLRGQSLPLVDLRRRLGLVSAADNLLSFTTMLKQREQDHLNWLSELEASVREKRSFDLTTDPHQCAFGKWYDSFETNNETLQRLMQQFDRPHRAIHAVAQKVASAVEDNDFETAHAIIEKTRENELAEMIKLFSDLTRASTAEARETTLVVETEDFTYAVAVDKITTVETIDEDALLPNPAVQGQTDGEQLVVAMGRRAQGDLIVQIIEPRLICDQADMPNQEPVAI